ncbi:hypothetical protein EPN29_13015 [bacterium]|nr:MAG: hypothetical protein EPN29_13015 [bacterium]
MRWLSLIVGIALVAVAFVAATRVADTREGLVAEVITLLGGLAGICLVFYGLFANMRPVPPVDRPATRIDARPATRIASAKDLLFGAGGLALAAVLLSGLAVSGGIQWAGLGLIALLPMIAGSAYLCARFLRSPARDWTLDLRRSKSRREP